LCRGAIAASSEKAAAGSEKVKCRENVQITTDACYCDNKEEGQQQ